jgi:hypothetical protein
MPALKIFGVFKMVRVFRLSSYICKLNIHQDKKGCLKLIKLIIYLGLLFHMMACIWYWTILQNAYEFDDNGRSLKWYPPYDWINYSDSKLFDEETSIIDRYSSMLYHAVLIIGNNEMGP